MHGRRCCAEPGVEAKLMRPVVRLALGVLAVCASQCHSVAVEPARSSQSYFGNTFSGEIWVQNSVDSAVVSDDGRIFTNSRWDEAGREAGIYRDGRPVGALPGLHGWGRHGGSGIAIVDGFVLAAVSQKGGYKYPEDDYPPPGETWFGVTRYTAEGEVASWPEGRGHAAAMVIVSERHPVTGMAAVGDRVAVAVAGENAIFVFEPATMQLVARWHVAAPGPLAAWGESLWCVPFGGGVPFEIGCDGKLTSRRLPDLTEAAAIAASADHLYVADAGSSQQIVVFAADLAETSRIGVAGGVYSEPCGALGAGRFGGISALAVDRRNGRLIVAETGGPSGFPGGNGLHLSAYDPAGRRLWHVYSLEFLDRGCIDPGDEQTIVTKDTLYRVDHPVDGPGPVAQPVATTLDPFRFPLDPRLHLRLCSADVVRPRGQRLMGLIDQRADSLAIFRFEGNTAIPAALFRQSRSQGSVSFPPGCKGGEPFFWQDANGDGSYDSDEFCSFEAGRGWAWHLDERGDVWFATEGGEILHFPLTAITHDSGPRWEGRPERYRVPEGLLTEVNRIDMNGDTLYVGGYSEADGKPAGFWGLIGTRLIRIDDFPHRPVVVWNIPLPHDGPEVDIQRRRLPKALDVEQGLVFVGYVTAADIDVFDAANGRLLTTLRPGKAVDEISGWFDIPYAIRSHRLTSGAWQVVAEEVWRGKNLLYELSDPRPE